MSQLSGRTASAPPGELAEAQCNAATSILCCQDFAILCLITLPPANLVRNPIRKPRGATKAIIGQSRINHGWDFVEAQVLGKPQFTALLLHTLKKPNRINGAGEGNRTLISIPAF